MMLNRWRMASALALALVLASPQAAEAVVATVTTALDPAVYTDLGAGPILLGANGGNVVYQIADSKPANSTSGYLQRVGDAPAPVQTTSHIWAIGGGTAVVAPFVGASGSGGAGGAVTESGAWSVGLTGTLPAFAATPTVNAAESGAWNIGNITGTVTLPTGAATAALQPALNGDGGALAHVTNPVALTASSSARNFPGCTVGVTSAACLAGATAVTFVQIQNVSASANMACAWGATAILNSSSSFQLTPGESASWGPTTAGIPSGALNCIASAASTPAFVEWN